MVFLSQLCFRAKILSGRGVLNVVDLLIQPYDERVEITLVRLFCDTYQ